MTLVESASKVPKLILNPFTSKVMIDEQEPFDPVDLIEQKCHLSFAEGGHFWCFIRWSSIGILDFFIESLDLFFDGLKLFGGVLRDVGNFGVLKGEESFP